MITSIETHQVELLHGEITGRVINAFYATYDCLGTGFLESVYRAGLALELADAGLRLRREVPIDVWMKGHRIGHFRADMIVNDVVILEIKASRAVDDADRRQVMNYLRATDVEVGLLLHFGPKPAFQRFFFENTKKQGSAAPLRKP
jgi:GxxExxY protein